MIVEDAYVVEQGQLVIVQVKKELVMPYTWSADLETGHAAIDNQHRQLIGAANALSDAHRNGKGLQEVERTMEFLVTYTVKHFVDEEKLQQTYNYPEYPAHKRLHDAFQSEIQELAEKLFQDGPTDEFIAKVYVTVGEWLFSHIKGEDFKMIAYIQACRARI